MYISRADSLPDMCRMKKFRSKTPYKPLKTFEVYRYMYKVAKTAQRRRETGLNGFWRDRLCVLTR